MDPQIILVTRDLHLRDALKRVCSGQSCRVETALSVAAAMEIAARGPVCILVTDASLEATGDGAGLVKTIHEQNAGTKCFLIVDENSSDVLEFTDNEPWLRVIPAPVPMLQFAAKLVDAIHESID
jgi:DNA-binding NtrC family response regulator